MTRVYLIRHAEAEGNLYRRCHGWYDSLITENGYRQIAALEERFRRVPIDAVYSSDLFRTMTTAGAIYKPRGLVLRTDPGLREVHMGDWEDRPWAELDREVGESMALFNITSPVWRAPGGESIEEVRQRVGRTIRALAARHEGETIAVFSHGCAIRNTLALFKGLSVADSGGEPHSDNTAVSLLEFEGGQIRIIFQDDNSHLTDELSTLARQRWWKTEGQKSTDQSALWFRELDLELEGELYLRAREEAWQTIHGTLEGFSGPAFLNEARFQQRLGRGTVRCAMLGEEIAGILQVDFDQDALLGAGSLPFYYMAPGFRRRGLGVQLLGEAVSLLRPMERDAIRLRCAPHNASAQRFYSRYGFVKVGEERGNRSPLDVLEKYIGYEEPV